MQTIYINCKPSDPTETGIVKTEILTFNDGEKHLILGEINRKDSVKVVCRIKSSDDLFILMQLSDILKRQAIEVGHFVIRYLMGMRCDRVFDFNRPFTLKIVADVINSFNAQSVSIIEPHSVRSINEIKNSSDFAMINFMTNKVRFDYKKGLETCFVAPDKGAKERYGLFVRFGIECSKVRDAATGKLSGFSNELLDGNPDKSNSNLVVIDDLCDGGGTFCGVADMLKEYNPKETTLMIIHAVNYAGILNVAKRFTNVYITNSYADYDNGEYELPPNVHVVKVPF